jgi:hypothetical protein
MFHVQLRQFPHNHSRFNLSDEELRSITELWVRGQWPEIGERKWNPQQAKLTVLESSQIPVQQLSMGRGWGYAQRHGKDVTQRVLSTASAALSGAASHPPAPSSAVTPTAHTAGVGDPSEEREPTISVVRPLLGEGPRAAALLAAWQQTASRFPERSPSECLALAERLLEVSPEEFTR